METNKPVTAEKCLKLHFGSDYWIIEHNQRELQPYINNAMEEYATLKTQQLTDQNKDLEDALTICKNSRNGNREKVQQLTAENEALKKRLEENRKSFRADLHHLRKHKAKLKAENERLREAVVKFLEAIPITGHNYYLSGFTEALSELKEAAGIKVTP